MSFQDFGKPGAGRRPQNYNHNARSSLPGPSVGGIGVGESRDPQFSAVSDAILQYQRNVGILERIMRNIGTKSDGPVLDTQLKVQVDVVQQLGVKIEKQLRDEEIRIQSMPRTEAGRSRATHIKLSRDYRRVETNFKNILLEAKRKRSLTDARRREMEEHDQRKKFEEGLQDDNTRFQIQIQEDKLNEEIMREREEEIRNINKGMHQVNEIYKDLAHIVASQQEQIDEVEAHMENANQNAESGLQQVEKANAASESSCLIS